MLSKEKDKNVLNQKASRLLTGLAQYAFDIVGLVLITLAVVTFLGLIHFTKGGIIDWWIKSVVKGFGWMSYILTILLAYIGILTLLRHIERFPKIDFARILLLEGFLFSISAFVAILGGFSVDRATAGEDGGIIGWGIARIINSILPLPVSSIILLLFSAVFILTGMDILNSLIMKLEAILERHLIAYYAKKPSALGDSLQESKESYRLQYQHGDANQPETLTQMWGKELPPITTLLEQQEQFTDKEYIHQKAVRIETTLGEFGVPARVVGYRVGPSVIQFALEPGYLEKMNSQEHMNRKKVRISQISALQQDLALALSAERLRIEAPIPGHSFVGIEIPNQHRSLVRLRPILESNGFQNLGSQFALALGLDVSNKPVVADLSRMPHLLIAGTTGSGKSVCITSIITCLIMNNTPIKLRIAIIDPKMVELVRFNGLPHLIGKVETEPPRMLAILSWAIVEMERRYKLLESMNARGLDTYNSKIQKRKGEELPRIVIIIDELADLMLLYPERTESSLVRLAQMARATGIHLVLATQRPSTDVVTGLIKANFPARISFMVATSIDSRVILDTRGAETLIGSGDMLFLDPEYGDLQRAQGVLIDDMEIEKIIGFWRNIKPAYKDKHQIAPWEEFVKDKYDSTDVLLDKALALIRKEGRASVSLIQRRLRIGYPRAARLMDELENQGIVGPPVSGGREREILIDNEFEDQE
ncbi:MAG TPA: DNA translocase FtsK [Anaerolineae bacterium]|nr:DNA translocase FtsK [Anaerolineae bacterium]